MGNFVKQIKMTVGPYNAVYGANMIYAGKRTVGYLGSEKDYKGDSYYYATIIFDGNYVELDSPKLEDILEEGRIEIEKIIADIYGEYEDETN